LAEAAIGTVPSRGLSLEPVATCHGWGQTPAVAGSDNRLAAAAASRGGGQFDVTNGPVWGQTPDEAVLALAV